MKRLCFWLPKYCNDIKLKFSFLRYNPSLKHVRAMMKPIRAFYALILFCGVIFAFDKDTAEIIQTYRTQNLEKTKKLLEKYLQDKNFWLSVVESRNVDYGYFENYDYLFVSNKAAPNLTLYKISKNGNLTRVNHSSALVGSGKGHKSYEGDLTTPIGVYDFTGQLKNLPQYYGPLAFATNYPNNYDKSRRKTGSGIWIHGLPLDGNREEKNTKGCIAIDNDILSGYGKAIDYSKAVLIIYEESFRVAQKEEIANLLASLYAWRDAWIRNDLKSYLGFYSKDFVRPDGMKHDAFVQYKTKIFSKQEEKSIIFSNISVIPYPNQEGRIMYRISFVQDYKAFKNRRTSYSSNGVKTLYVEYANKKMQILSE